jgi:ankyrin repeat protein
MNGKYQLIFLPSFTENMMMEIAMKKTILFLCFGILFSNFSQAGAPPELYCKILQEADNNDINKLKIYLAKDETGKPQIHLEGEVEYETDIPSLMKDLHESDDFETPRLIETRKDNPEEEITQFHISFAPTNPFDLAAKEGKKDATTGELHWQWKQTICEGGAPVDVNSRGSDGKPYLIGRIRNFDNAEEIAVLLNAGANPNVNDPTWGTPLSNAALICSSEVIKVLLKAGAKVNEVDSVKQTALGYSSLQNFSTDNCIETAEILLQSGASIKGDCEVILRASMASVKSTKAPKLVEKLIAAGGDVNCTDERTGATPLINASAEGNAAIVKMLLSKGADPNIKMMDGSTALKIAQEGDYQEIVKLLSTGGAK